MMQHEFEERAGLKITADEYAEIEREYMAIPDEMNIQKDEFCKLWNDSRAVRMDFFPYLVLLLKKRNDYMERELKGAEYLVCAANKDFEKTLAMNRELSEKIRQIKEGGAA